MNHFFFSSSLSLYLQKTRTLSLKASMARSSSAIVKTMQPSLAMAKNLNYIFLREIHLFLLLEIYLLCCKICTNIQNHPSVCVREREREREYSHNYHPLKIKILTFGKGPLFLFSLSTTWTLEEYHNPQKHKADSSDHKKHTSAN